MGRGDKKKRSFCFTLHNVKDYNTKHTLEKYVKPATTRYLIGCEEYPETPGEYHLHLFVTYRNARYFEPTIQEYQDYNLDNLVGPKPEGREGFWGRVQVSEKYGTYQECKRYLQGITKDKPVDPEISEYRGPEKGFVRCDVCQQDFHWTSPGYQYMDDRSLGRCYLCSVWSHSALQQWGHNVRNMDEYRKISWSRISQDGRIYSQA